MLLGGYAGKTLFVDLTSRKISVKPLELPLIADFIGGRGFTSKLQFDNVRQEDDPLSPENILVFATGPMTGTPTIGGSRFTVGGRSPLTGILGDSNCGGHWGPELKFAGFDYIIVKGRSEKPVYLWINDGAAELKPAETAWGKDTKETGHVIAEELGQHDIHVASIGQAGENLVRYANVIVEGHHAAGRTGMGAVMGSKKLKAIAVKGTGDIRIFTEKKLEAATSKMLETLAKDKVASKTALELGTPLWVDLSNEFGTLGTRNHQSGVFSKVDEISGETLREKYLITAQACFMCPIRCKRYVEVTDGEFAGTHTGGPEFLCIQKFGSGLDNGNLASVIKAHELCNLFGLDITTTGGTLAFAYECYEKGLLTRDDTDGLPLDWGNYDTMLKLIEKITFKRGIGELLSEGSYRAGKRIGKGAEKYSMSIKGMEICADDPRTNRAYAYRYILSSRGGDHLRGMNFSGALLMDLGNNMDKTAKLLKHFEDYNAAINMLGVCIFCYNTYCESMENYHARQELLAEMYSAVTGIEASVDTLLQAGERVINLERVYNARMGISRTQDAWPERFLVEPAPNGPAKGQIQDYYPELSNAYYRVRGWDQKAGWPAPGKLRELKLPYAIKEIKSLKNNAAQA